MCGRVMQASKNRVQIYTQYSREGSLCKFTQSIVVLEIDLSESDSDRICTPLVHILNYYKIGEI